MNVRAAAIAALLIAAQSPFSAAGATDKQLANMRGQVAYQGADGHTQSVALHATVALADRDYAITGIDSLAGIELPDSSRVLVGSSTKVQLAFFNQAEIASAKFVVFNGKVRFAIEHPHGARANYVFQTPTAQIAVRGTIGDIDVEPQSLQVNVYKLTDVKLPVQVTLNDGRVFLLHAGQSLIVHAAAIVAAQAAVLHAAVAPVSPANAQTFGEFGAPANASAAGGAGAVGAGSAAAAPAAATAATAATVASTAILPAIISAVVIDTAVVTASNATRPPGAPKRTVPIVIQFRW